MLGEKWKGDSDTMANNDKLKTGDHVEWNTSQGKTSGKVKGCHE
ncbi:MAG: hypothetical protein PVS3B3_03900 [Ktedonobacteraceae bacterium]